MAFNEWQQDSYDLGRGMIQVFDNNPSTLPNSCSQDTWLPSKGSRSGCSSIHAEQHLCIGLFVEVESYHRL